MRPLPYLTDTRLLVPPPIVRAGVVMDSPTRTSMSRAKRRGESPAPSSSGHRPTRWYPLRPRTTTSRCSVRLACSNIAYTHGAAEVGGFDDPLSSIARAHRNPFYVITLIHARTLLFTFEGSLAEKPG